MSGFSCKTWLLDMMFIDAQQLKCGLNSCDRSRDSLSVSDRCAHALLYQMAIHSVFIKFCINFEQRKIFG